jgi:hypothetical protein
MFHICGDVEAVCFPVQNVYKTTYGDENATFEPVNGYGFVSYFAFRASDFLFILDRVYLAVERVRILPPRKTLISRDPP